MGPDPTGVSGTMVGAVLRSTGDKLTVSDHKPIFVQGAWNLGAIIVYKEIETAGFNPGMTVDPVAAGAGVEDNVTIMATASTDLLGIAEIDFGQLADTTVAYAIADDAPIIFFHWNPGALLQNVYCVDPDAAIEPGELLGTTSGTSGYLKDDTTTAVCMRSYKYVADGGAVDHMLLAFIHGYL